MSRRADRAILFCVALCFTALLPAVAAGQDVQKLLVAAYSLRRRGRYRAAAAAFEQILGQLNTAIKKNAGSNEKLTADLKESRRLLALETAELYEVMEKPGKAILLYRKNNDVPREIDALLKTGDPKHHKEALTISRYVKYARGEALALARLGQTDEALKLMEQKGLARDRADLLAELGRFTEAAAIYEQVQNFYAQARALKQAGKTRDAERAFEDTITQLRFELKDESGSLTRVRQITALHRSAERGVVLERTRLALAKAYGRLAGDYRKLAEAYASTGRDDYRAKAPKFASNAASYYTKQRELLEDKNGPDGGDAYGAKLAEILGVAQAAAEAQQEAVGYRGG